MQLRQFLIQAKQNTVIIENLRTRLEDGSIEQVYTEERFRYRSRSYGVNPFIGEELVWEDGILTWGMNYYGSVQEELIPPSQVFNFLSQAQQMARPERPYRGPEFFRAGQFTYIDKSQGDLDGFSGEEIIYFRDQQVYRLIYHGGKIR